MKSRKTPILIVDADLNFREELHNFLLSAGYEEVQAVSSVSKAIEKIVSAYDVIIADANSSFAKELNFSRSIVDSQQNAIVILMIRSEDQKDWRDRSSKSDKFKMLIKPTFAQNLLYLIEERARD